MPKVNKYFIKKREENEYYNMGSWVKLNNAYVYNRADVIRMIVHLSSDLKFVRVEVDGKLTDLFSGLEV
jgi:hypothetical protein